ncbi:MAG: deoxyribonuclease IV [Muribaculaceae bacterium]|nr:deoxyribonuclease IV [Muribaculaceae bacterium]
MKFLGAHIDDETSPARIPALAADLGANAFAFCPSNPRRWFDSPLEDSQIEDFKKQCSIYGFTPAQILPHASLLLNLCSPDSRKLSLSRNSLADQMKRCRSLGLTMLNFHPGATINEGITQESCDLVARSINYVLERTQDVVAVIENTAGQGTSLGYDFSHLAEIIKLVDDKERVGVCIDTCHAFAAGYDFAGGYNRVWDEFDSLIGFKYLKGMHLNDSMRPLGSRVDRHAPIGKGAIGSDFFANIMADRRLDGIPLILETPDPSLWKIEIDWMRGRMTD